MSDRVGVAIEKPLTGKVLFGKKEEKIREVGELTGERTLCGEYFRRHSLLEMLGGEGILKDLEGTFH